MIATQDKEMTVAAKKLYNKNQDEVARLWAQAHEDFLWEERIRKKRAEKLEKEMAEKEKMIKSMDQEIDRLRSILAANGINPN